MVVVSAHAPHGDSVAALPDEIVDGYDDLQPVLDSVALEPVAAGGEKDGKEEEEEEELEWLSNKDAFPTLETMAPAEAGAEAARPRRTGVRRRRSEATGSPLPAPAKAERRCRDCGTDETPQWCNGPEGPGTLCNACGNRHRPKEPGRPAPAPAKATRLCRHCGTDKTPQWRKGPEGPGTLCNACGTRHRAERLVPEYRPRNSPTFSPELHSNRHQRVAALVRRREEESTKESPAAATGD